MNNPTFDSIIASMEEIARAIAKAARHCIGAISAMSWPALMVSCVALALAITIVPLALGLFIIFLLVKLVFTTIGERASRGKPTPYKNVDETGNGE
jgi:hypothetical protein